MLQRSGCPDVVIPKISAQDTICDLLSAETGKQGSTHYNSQSFHLLNNQTITMKLAILATLLTTASAFSVGKVRTH